MWTEIAAETEFHNAQPPFSFFFDVVRRFWRAPSCAPRNVAFHRICTLARKMGVQSIVIESALHRDDVRKEIDALDSALGSGGSAEAVAVSFLRDPSDKRRLANLPSDSLLGQAVVINYKKRDAAEFCQTYVFEAIVRIPALSEPTSAGQKRSPSIIERVRGRFRASPALHPLLNNYFHSRKQFHVPVLDSSFSVEGVYYCQQNGVTSVCAHACLRMALNTIDSDDQRISTSKINDILGFPTPIPPNTGLTLQQIQTVLATKNLKPLTYTQTPASPQLFENVFELALYSIIESGYPALLGFSTGTALHIIPAYGHTLNSDEWHPEARPAYTGPPGAKYHSSSSWADHFLIHDDNFGPYYCLSQSSIRTAPLKPHSVIGLLPEAIALAPFVAEAIASYSLQSLASIISGVQGNWPSYLQEVERDFVLRTLLIDRASYKRHLEESVGHDGSRVLSSELTSLDQLPPSFWMVEFSLPSLYTGNKSKLGEVLVAATAEVRLENVTASLIGLRAPGRMLIKEGSELSVHELSLVAHSALYRQIDRGHEW